MGKKKNIYIKMHKYRNNYISLVNQVNYIENII